MCYLFFNWHTLLAVCIILVKHNNESSLWIKILKISWKSLIYLHTLPKNAYLSRYDQSLQLLKCHFEGKNLDFRERTENFHHCKQITSIEGSSGQTVTTIVVIAGHSRHVSYTELTLETALTCASVGTCPVSRSQKRPSGRGSSPPGAFGRICWHSGML